MNGSIHVATCILKIVVCSAAEVELHRRIVSKSGKEILRSFLMKIGHPQLSKSVNCGNSTAAGVANDTVKRQRSRLGGTR